MDALKGIGHACGHNLIGMSGYCDSLNARNYETELQGRCRRRMRNKNGP